MESNGIALGLAFWLLPGMLGLCAICAGSQVTSQRLGRTACRRNPRCGALGNPCRPVKPNNLVAAFGLEYFMAQKSPWACLALFASSETSHAADLHVAGKRQLAWHVVLLGLLTQLETTVQRRKRTESLTLGGLVCEVGDRMSG